MELHGWSRGYNKHALLERRICVVALIICILLVIAVAAFRSFIGDSLASSPTLSINFPRWVATDWSAQTVASWIAVVPHKTTFIETLLSLPIFIGWGIHNHPVWGLPLLFCSTLIILALWRLAAHILGTRKPSVFFPALIALQCAALGWGWTFYAPPPYHLSTKLSVIDMKGTSASILSNPQKISWHQRNGYTGFVFRESPDNPYKTEFPKMLFIAPATAQAYKTQFTASANWWLFPPDISTEEQLEKHWKSGKVAAVSLQDPPISAWRQLPIASLINVFLSFLTLLIVAILYGIQPPPAPLSAPGRITGFLQKNRRLKRWGGMAMMVLAFAGTMLALWLTFYPAWGFMRLETLPITTTFILCVALDYGYWQGRKSWKKLH
ncbi:MAG: hypothetical protein ABI210_01030 [Abditibacteriaceae bacterium]